MADMMCKVRLLRDKFPLLNIQVDGGISTSNVDVCAQAGANMIVSGTGIIEADDPETTIDDMKQAVEKVLAQAK